MSNIHGVGGQPGPIGGRGAEGKQAAEVAGDLKGFGKATLKEGQSLISQAQVNAFVPTAPQNTQMTARAQIQDVGDGDGDVDKAEGENEDDKKEKKEKKDVKEGQIARVSDVDPKQQRRQQEGLFARLERMAQQKKIQGWQDLVDILNQEYDDITEVYDAARDAQQFFSEKEDSDVGTQLSASSKMAADLMIEDEVQGPDIRAGFILGTQDKEGLQAYRQHVLRFEKVSDTFAAMMTKADGKVNVFERDMDKLLKSLKADMAAQESTLDPVHLREINDGMYKVHICTQTFRDCELLLQNMGELHNVGPYAGNE